MPTPSRPIRVLQVLGTLAAEGIQTWLLGVLRNLDRDRFQVDVMVQTAAPGAYDTEVRALGSQVLSCLRPTRPWEYAHNFRRLVREHGPYDLVHAHVANYNGIVGRLAHQCGIPAILLHSRSTRDTRTVGVLGGLYGSLMRRWMDRYATHLLAISKDAGASLFGPQVCTDPRFRVITTAVELQPFAEAVDRAAIRDALGLQPEELVVGHVGRFESVKNHGFLVRVAAAVVGTHPNTRFVFVGDGPLRGEIENQIREAGLEQHFLLTGVRRDVPHLMKGAMDVLVFPSLWEGLGRVVVEAQAAGLPCVYSDVVPEEADVIPPLLHRQSLAESPAQWAQTIIAAGTQPRPLTAAAALERMDQSAFNIQQNVNELQRLYESAVPH